MNLQYITYQNIDKEKWDRCIRKSQNCLVYAESTYLDHMAANWDAIILGDYEAVMPLTWKKKWGINYLYQPAFLQQGGIYSPQIINNDIIVTFINLARQYFNFAEINLNHKNIFCSENPDIITQKKNNFTINISEDYTAIYSRYKKSLKEKLTRINKYDLHYQTTNNFSNCIGLFKTLYQKRTKVRDNDFKNFELLCHHLDNNNQLVIRQVIDTDKQVLSYALLINDSNRLYFIMTCITDVGKKKFSNYFLIDELIKEFSQQNYMLDFEGSDIKGIADFYKNFTETNEEYLFVKWNNLPFPIHIFKR